MASWILKAVVQKTLSLFPNSHVWNRVLQERLTGSLRLSQDRVADQFRRCARHLDSYVRLRGAVPQTVLEVGTGWMPILPLGFSLCGCREVWSVDRVSLMRPSDVENTLRMTTELHRAGRLAPMLPRLQGDRVSHLLDATRPGDGRDPIETLERLGIHCRIAELSRLPVGEGSVDLAVSNSVLEHLRQGEIEALFRQIRRLVARDGVTSHFIDLADHYANFDRRLDVYNFFKFPEPVWALINSSLHYQNRLRISDYRRLFTQTGWRIVGESSERGTESDLEPIPLARRFRRYAREDLLVYRSWITGSPEGA
jgi:hypothetical protein